VFVRGLYLISVASNPIQKTVWNPICSYISISQLSCLITLCVHCALFFLGGGGHADYRDKKFTDIRVKNSTRIHAGGYEVQLG
jgi:hypothetical protein